MMQSMPERKERKGPNHLWHIDTNHKLVRWYLVIVGVIDGFSRLPVAIECQNNNKAETVLQCFLKGVELFGLPSRVHSHKGRENNYHVVADYMITRRGANRGSMITEKARIISVLKGYGEMFSKVFWACIINYSISWRTKVY